MHKFSTTAFLKIPEKNMESYIMWVEKCWKIHMLMEVSGLGTLLVTIEENSRFCGHQFFSRSLL